MGLGQQLADFKAEFLRIAPVRRAALCEAKIEELRASFTLEAAVGVGAVALISARPLRFFRNVKPGGNNP